MKKEPMKSFEIIKEMYEHFVKKSRKKEPKLMICEKEDFDNVETALKKLNNIETTAIDLEQENKALYKENKKLKRVLEIIKEKGCLQFCIIGVSLEDYNNSVDAVNKDYGYDRYKHYTKEEIDLLREVL